VFGLLGFLPLSCNGSQVFCRFLNPPLYGCRFLYRFYPPTKFCSLKRSLPLDVVVVSAPPAAGPLFQLHRFFSASSPVRRFLRFVPASPPSPLPPLTSKNVSLFISPSCRRHPSPTLNFLLAKRPSVLPRHPPSKKPPPIVPHQSASKNGAVPDSEYPPL